MERIVLEREDYSRVGKKIKKGELPRHAASRGGTSRARSPLVPLRALRRYGIVIRSIRLIRFHSHNPHHRSKKSALTSSLRMRDRQWPGMLSRRATECHASV